eukprot:7718773-Lingulodinium_polyedra.AAC.1
MAALAAAASWQPGTGRGVRCPLRCWASPSPLQKGSFGNGLLPRAWQSLLATVTCPVLQPRFAHNP